MERKIFKNGSDKTNITIANINFVVKEYMYWTINELCRDYSDSEMPFTALDICNMLGIYYPWYKKYALSQAMYYPRTDFIPDVFAVIEDDKLCFVNYELKRRIKKEN